MVVTHSKKEWFGGRSVAQIRADEPVPVESGLLGLSVPEWMVRQASITGFRRKGSGALREYQQRMLAFARDVLSAAQSLQPGQHLALDHPLFMDDGVAAKFLRHGPEVLLNAPRSAESARRLHRTPRQLQMNAYDYASPNRLYCAFSFHPCQAPDMVKRKVCLDDVIEGCRIYAFGEQEGIPIEVEAYDDARKVAREGATVHVRVPSCSTRKSRYKIGLKHVPVVDTPEKYVFVHGLSTNHTCGDKMYNKELRYCTGSMPSDVVQLCKHIHAAMFKIADHYWNEEGNIIPYQMSVTPVPTFEAVRLQAVLKNAALVSCGGKMRKLYQAEREALLELKALQDFEGSFFSRSKPKDYSWL